MILIPVILSGGTGSRLWPVSRELHPKPFMKMEDGESLLQKTFCRALNLPSVSEVMTVTNRDLYFQTEDEYLSVNTKELPTSFILEPFGRNTAPAVAIAALQIVKKYGEEAVLLVMSADHLIKDQDKFNIAVSQASKLAQQGHLVTFGIQPEFPETGYGYIKIDSDDAISSDDCNCYRVKKFIEKPSFNKAKKYFDSGNYFWNSGIFCFTAGTVIAELQQHAPEVLNTAQDCLDKSRSKIGNNSQEIQLDPDTFNAQPDISIDYALMEKSSKGAVVTCDIGWSDIGSWSAISDLKQADTDGNRIVGEALLHDVTNCYIQNEGRMIGAVGVNDLIIIDTTDALLIIDKKRSQDVKTIVNQLKNSGHNLHRIHPEVHRPWGTYIVLEEGKHFKIKRIVVKPNASLSLQLHHHRNEHWIVIQGIAQVTNNGENYLLKKNESTYIVAGHQHRLENPGIVDLVIIEVQSGEYLNEDDIVRFDDMYGRT
jgi:mannose-1-phosphate guanylyltransferase / mannose-6-phosphate isomerase